MNTSTHSQHAMSIAEFCRAYGIGKTSAYAEIASGRLRVRKVGRRTLVLKEEAEAWASSLPSTGDVGRISTSNVPAN